MANLSLNLRSGALWNYFQGGTRAVIQFASGIVLARLLDPADFGVFFAVTAYTALLTAQVRFGIPMALLQAEEPTEEQWNSAFWFMEGIAILALVLVAALAGTLAAFYEDSRYTYIMLLMALAFPVQPFMAINGTLLRRRMDFKTVSIIQIQASLTSTAVSLITAFAGLGPYCFVAGGLTSVFLSAALMARKAPWKPRLLFSYRGFRSLFDYAWKIHLNGTLDSLTHRVDNMILGKLLGLGALGIYMRAFSLSRLPLDNLCSPIYQLAFSAFSRIQRNLDHSVRMYRKILCATTTVVFPVLLAFIFLADGLIQFIYGEKWLPAALPLQIMAVGSFFTVISMMTATLTEAQNLVGRQTPIEVGNLLMTIAAVTLGAQWGLAGVAAGIAIKAVLVQFLILRLAKHSHIEIPLRAVFTAVLPAITASLAAAITVQLTSPWLQRLLDSDPRRLDYIFTAGSLLLLVYGVTWFAFYRLRPDEAQEASVQLMKDIATRITSKRRKA